MLFDGPANHKPIEAKPQINKTIRYKGLAADYAPLAALGVACIVRIPPFSVSCDGDSLD
jgi:hypothetical protein